MNPAIPTITATFHVQGHGQPVPIVLKWWSEFTIDERVSLWEHALTKRDQSFPSEIGPSLTLPEPTRTAAMNAIRQLGYQRELELADMGFANPPKHPPRPYVDTDEIEEQGSVVSPLSEVPMLDPQDAAEISLTS